ncbi:hypothetical protein MUS1_10060 [Marinomonas ushuaiensis DSM 15871]|uniref:Uncharacterized protein n=1 Tax=Marinomonas ushuaiensis DSM 15871 TaxID=1122207 RepID=X7E6V6_9GAMM|nr:hypothetical protein [Marinomonas ushuaiensis]ETX11605.1 hypothetical protein MUS1_10060 [Marinomonas ushuaiensis DSM 15871]
MSFKLSLSVVFFTSLTALTSTNAFAIDDYCTPKLNSYIEKAEKTVDSKYISSSQKEMAQKVIDKVKASRNETNDCILMDELF